MRIWARPVSARKSPLPSPTRPSSIWMRRWPAPPCPTSRARIIPNCWMPRYRPWMISAHRLTTCWSFEMQQESTEIRAPEQNSGDNVIFQGWLKEAGSAVTLDEPVAELETDKIVVEVAAPCDGILETLVEEGAAVTSEMLLGHVRAAEQQPADNPAGTAAQEQPAAPAPAAKRPERAAAADADRRELRLSPSVRQLVRKHDIADPSVIEGTGRRGRVTRKDVLAELDHRQDMPAQTARATAPAAAVASQPAPDGGGERIPHSTMRRRVAEHMLQSVTTAPHVTAVFEADFSAIMAHRKAHKEGYA